MSPIQIDPRKTAIVVIDLQKGIVAMPTEPRPSADVVTNATRIANALRERGGFVTWVRVAHSPDLKDRLAPPSDAPGPAGTPAQDWADLVPELGVKPTDHVVTKRQWGAFYGTDLELQLRRRGVDTIILCGIATAIGVESTARDAFERGFAQIFAEDALASRSAAEHENSIARIFPRIGQVRPTAEILRAIETR